MLDFMTQGNGNILGIRATGKLSDQDYQHVLAPRVQSLRPGTRRRGKQ